MSGPEWRRYSSQDPDIRKKAVRIREDSEKTVLVARADWCFGDFTVGETHAWVSDLKCTYRLEDFEVLIAPEEDYFQWVECWGGYVPKFTVYLETSSDNYDVTLFVSRQRGANSRGGSILPEMGECYFPKDSGRDEKRQHYQNSSDKCYDALQVAPKYWASVAELPGLLFQRMDEEQVLSELNHLFQKYFHGDASEFHNSIVILWIKSGMDTNFFFAKALQWLLGLARVHGFPLCFSQCLAQLLKKKQLSNEEQLLEAIKLARLFNRCCTKEIVGGSSVAEYALPLELDIKNHSDGLKRNHQGTALHALSTELVRTLHGIPIGGEEVDEINSETSKKEFSEEQMLKEGKQIERRKRKSLLPLPGQNRAPVPHSIMVQRTLEELDLGMQMDFENEQMITDISCISQNSFEVDASREAGNYLLLPVSQFLAHTSVNSEQLNSEIFSNLTEILKNMAEEQFFQNDATVLYLLKLIRDKCSSYSTDTAEVMCKYLENGRSQRGRLYCAQWLQRMVEEIKMQKDQWNSKTFPHADILTDIIATKPIVLTLAGTKPLYFTHSINQPILEILNHFKVKLRKAQWKVIKYIWKFFGKDAKPQETLTSGWEDALKEGLRYLFNQADAIPKSIFEAVDKVFVEQDNCSVLPTCAEFIHGCLKRRVNSEHVKMSSQFLEQLCRRLLLSRSATHRLQYLECLHVLSEWQELPDDIFRVYHMEVGAARLLSFSQGNNEKRVISDWGLDISPYEVQEVTSGILERIKDSLEDSCNYYFLSQGILEAYMHIEAYMHTEALKSCTKVSFYNWRACIECIKDGLTAAAAKGHVIPEHLLAKLLEGLSKSSMGEPDSEHVRAYLKNQSLPDQWLTRRWEYLMKTEEPLKRRGYAESNLIIICTSYLLNRKLPVSPENHDSSTSTIWKSSHRENLIFFLFEKFFTKEASADLSLRETMDLLHRANDLAEKNIAKISIGMKSSAVVDESEQELRQFLKLMMVSDSREAPVWIFRDPESQRRFIPSLRSNSAIRKHFREILQNQNFTQDLLSFGGGVMLYFARAAFIAMVTSSTEEAAWECGEILELICTNSGRVDKRLNTVFAPLERMQKLGIQLFKCVKHLMKTLQIGCPLLRAKCEDKFRHGSRPGSFFNRHLDAAPARWGQIYAEEAADTKETYLGHGDLAEEILLAAHKIDFCKSSFSLAEPSDGDTKVWFQIVADLAREKYRCPPSLLMQCLHEHVIAASRPFPLSHKVDEDEHKAAPMDLIVYRSVISSLEKIIRSKVPTQDNSAGFLKQTEESIMVLAAELLEAFDNKLSELNYFLTKLSAVNVDTLWRILPALYDYEYYFLQLNIRNNDYEIEIEWEYIMFQMSHKLDKKPRMRRFIALALRSWLRQGYSFSSMNFRRLSDEDCPKQIQAAVRFAVHKVFNLWDNEEALQLFRQDELDDVNLEIHKASRSRVQSVLSLTELFDKLAAVVRSEIPALTETDLFSRIYDVVYSDDRKIIVSEGIQKKSVCLKDLTLQDIKNWSDYVRVIGVDPIEAICVASRALKLWRSWDLTVVQVLAIFLGLSPSNQKNCFLELSTGSGKSVVIAVIATVKALKGNKVDVFTSNHLLARRDAQEWKEFYAFFKLKCSSNGDEAVTYVNGPKECYGKNIDIVYGDIKQFQFDTLRTEFMGLGTRPCERPYDDVIIDEVDSVLLDEGSRLAMLSTAFTGMDKLEPIYHFIRSKLIQFDSEQTYYCHKGTLYRKHTGDLKERSDLETPRREFLKQNLEEFIRNLLGTNTTRAEAGSTVEGFKLPPHLMKFAKSQVSNWAEAAITAEALEEDKDYLLVDNKVVPIDPNNGTLQPSSNWTNGLQQFLQIKREVEFTPESPTTNYLSNWAMVNKYKYRVIGLTGTLGTPESFELLSEHMSADCIPIPDLHPSRFVQFPNLLVQTRQEWRDAILYSTGIEISYGRSVLVICQTVKEARSVFSDLLTEAKFSVKLHARSDIWREHHLQQIQPRDVIVTTTLGTRGMDIRASAIEAAGGLHVILAYMPPNTRIVKQAFGRTARKGNAGSGQFIIKQKYGTLEPSDILKHIKDTEMTALKKYFKHDLPSLVFKDEVYSGFQAQYSVVREEVQKLKISEEQLATDQIKDVFGKTNELSWGARIILEAIQELWATHLKKTIEQAPKYNKMLHTNELKVFLNEAWMAPHFLFEKTENCFHPTRYGFQLYRKLPSSKEPKPAFHKKYVVRGLKSIDTKLGNYNQVAKSAMDYLELATRLAPELSPAAHVGIAYVLLKGRKNLPNIGDHQVDHKTNALNYLRKATEMLTEEICYYRGCQRLLSNPFTSPLAAHLTEKKRALEAYVTVVEETSRAVELSLRSIEVTYKRVMDDTTHILSITDGNSTSTEELKQGFGVFDTENEIQIAFHGLKANKDLGYIYQAEDAVRLLYDSLNMSNLKGNQPTVSLWIEGNDIRKVFEASAFPQFSDNEDEEEGEDQDRNGNPSFNVSSDYKPSFTLALSSVKSWDNVVRTANALRYNKKTPKPYIVLTVATADVAEKLLSSQDDASSAESEETTCKQSISGKSGTATSPLEWTKYFAGTLADKIQEPVIASLSSFFNSRESCSAISRKNISRHTVPRKTSESPLENETQLTICTERLEGPATLFDALINGHIKYDVIFEDVHLEDDEVTQRNRSILQESRRLTIRFPKLRLAEDMRKMADEIIESVRYYCKMFRGKGVRPTLEYGNLESSLAEMLYKKVNRVSEPIQQLKLVPLADLNFVTAPSSEALRQIEQQGLLLVAKFEEKNAIPKKAIALVSSVAAGELIVSGILFSLGLPCAAPLITMALGDVRKAYKVHRKREFSLVEFVVKKAIQVAKNASFEIIDNWVRSFFSSLRDASPDQMENIVIRQWALLAPSEVFQAGTSVTATLFFLYLKYVGGNKIVKAIKDQIKTIEPTLKMPLVDENNIKKLLDSYQAVVSTGLNANPDGELRKWLQNLNDVDLWCSMAHDGVQVVDWTSLQDSATKETNFGACLLYAIQKVVAQNANIYFTLGCVKVIEEFKNHCLNLCMDVLVGPCQFEPHEAEIVSSQMSPNFETPVSEIRRILGTETSLNLLEAKRLILARRRFDEIADAKHRADLSFSQDGLLEIHQHLTKRLQTSELVAQLIQDSVSTTFEETKRTAKIINLPSSAPENAVSPILNPNTTYLNWEQSSICRLMEKMKTCAAENFSRGSFEDSSSAQLASLIIYLHEKCVDAAIVRLGVYEELKAKHDGDFGVPFVIVFGISPHDRLLEPLKVIREKTETTFRSLDLILKALSYISGDSLEVIRSFESAHRSTEEGRRIRACLCHFISIVNGKGEL